MKTRTKVIGIAVLFIIGVVISAQIYFSKDNILYYAINTLDECKYISIVENGVEGEKFIMDEESEDLVSYGSEFLHAVKPWNEVPIEISNKYSETSYQINYYDDEKLLCTTDVLASTDTNDNYIIRVLDVYLRKHDSIEVLENWINKK